MSRINSTFVVKGSGVLHLAVRVLGPGFQDLEGSIVDLPQAVEMLLHAGGHETSVAGGKLDILVHVFDEFFLEAGRITLDVVKNRSAQVRFFTIWITVPQCKRVWYHVIDASLSNCRWQYRDSSSE